MTGMDGWRESCEVVDPSLRAHPRSFLVGVCFWFERERVQKGRLLGGGRGGKKAAAVVGVVVVCTKKEAVSTQGFSDTHTTRKRATAQALFFLIGVLKRTITVKHV